MPFTDLETALPGKLQTLRETAETAHPTQALDATTLFLAEVARIEALETVVTPIDALTELAQAWLVST